MKLLTLLLTFILFSYSANADSIYTIKVNFLYGSKPIKKYKTEKKAFGGIHGGHVSIEFGNYDYGLSREGKVHVFPKKKNHHGTYRVCNTDKQSVYPEGLKTATIIIPLTLSQVEKMKKINQEYSEKTPYDYAFFGMRCAASAQYVLGQLGILKQRTLFGSITKAFYPKHFIQSELENAYSKLQKKIIIKLFIKKDVLLESGRRIKQVSLSFSTPFHTMLHTSAKFLQYQISLLVHKHWL